MKCPHCLVQIHDKTKTQPLAIDLDGAWVAAYHLCPACRRIIIHLACGEPTYDDFRQLSGIKGQAKRVILAYPRGAARPAPPAMVPEDLAGDYREAASVLPESPKAAAALSRRCLQHLLREHAKVKPGNLADEIQAILDSGNLPSHLAEAIDAVRNIGNFAAHPMKSQSTGEVLPVEPGEAEWTLDVLDALFDFFFVQPSVLRRKKDALNAKLTEAGKKPAK